MNISQSWLVQHFQKWLPVISMPSVWRLRNHILQTQSQENDTNCVLDMQDAGIGKVHLRQREADLEIFEEIFIEKVYQSVPAALSHCKTVIDIGSNIGLATLYFSSIYKEARFFCVEPDDSNYATLESNLRGLVKQGRASTLKGALWHKECDVEIQDESAAAYAITVRESGPSGGSVKILKGYPIEKILAMAGFDQIDLLKVDVEGAEIHLFTNASEWLPRVRAIAIEFHDNTRAETEFDSVMAANGFQIVSESHHTVLAKRSDS